MKRQTYFRIIRFSISLILIVYLYSRIELNQFKALFLKIDIILFAYLFPLLFVNTLISSYKWQLLLRTDSIHIPLKNLFRSYLIGSFFNIFLPSNIGGDFYRVYDISRYSSKPINSFASVFADRFSGFFALVSLALVFSIYGNSLLIDYRLIFLIFIIFILFILVFWTLYYQDIFNRIFRLSQLYKIKRLDEIKDKFLYSIYIYGNKPYLMLKIIGLSFLFQAIAVSCVFILAISLNIRIPIIYFYIFVPLISIIEAVPISIYGLGIRDASYVFFFTQIGLSNTQALSISLLYVIVTIIYSSIGGILFASRPDTEDV